MSVKCRVFRASKRDGLYIYVRDDLQLEDLPAALLLATGRLDLALELDLHPGRTLVRAEVAVVIQALEDKGFYVQMPPTTTG